ncbi:AraC family transcriptional regulator [Deinococcus alpinitundrae]|uniref:AraC family transcriptional regulator n=1 Tax=Deinococcus alpinitundrae TaxID=468913 RepID=UPI00137AF05E|nr:helix-turn-helix domain-containing protein [Deinococcus alpinitundrae]
MRFRHHDPDPRLRELVDGYWEFENVHLTGPHQNYDMAERTVRLMFSADTLLVGPTADTLRPVSPVVLAPFTVQPQRTVVQGKLRALVAELYPWGARQLLGWQAATTPDTLDASLSASPWGREIVALVQQGEWNTAREALEAHLLHLAGLHSEPGTAMQAAQQIYQSFGMVRIAALAEELNLSTRTLERQFAQQVGLSAKTLARVVRFDEVNIRIRMNPAVSMADLTFELGFTDQAHLTREFKALSSMTPGAFAAVAASRQHDVDLALLQSGGDLYIELESRPDFAPGLSQTAERTRSDRLTASRARI